MPLELTTEEKKMLRHHKVAQKQLLDYAEDEIEVLLNVSEDRAREIHALCTFQTIPSIGIKFAQDLVFLGYYDLDSLKTVSGHTLLNQYEKKKGYRTDVCVEDQFWLVSHVAKTGDYSKKWWDFTPLRKAYREANGYPSDRPETQWFEISAEMR